MKKERDITFDILKGIGILFMLTAHSLGGYVHSFAYSFHMPLFFIVSGYFFRKKPIKECAKSNFQRLILPLVFTILLMFLISIIENIFGVDGVRKPKDVLEMLLYANGSSSNFGKIFGDFSNVGSPWFLGCLFWAKLVYNMLSERMVFYNLAVVTFILSVLSVICGQYILLPYSLLQGLSVLPFLWIGEYARKEQLTHGLLAKQRFIIAVLVVGWSVSTFYDVLNIAGFKWDWYVIPNILFSAAGVWVMYCFSKLISRLPYVSRFVAILGEFSIVFVCFPVIESYFIPIKEIIPDIPFKFGVILAIKVLWAILSFLIVVNIPFLRIVYGVNKELFKKL